MTTDTEQVDKLEPDEKPFGEHEEKAIISLAFDMPEFFTQVGQFMNYKFFKLAHHQYVYLIIEDCFKKHGCIPTRELALDIARDKLKVDDDWEVVIETIERKSDFREIPVIKARLLDWTRHKAFGLLYGDEAYQAYTRKEYETLEGMFEKARRITDISNRGVRFFDNIQSLFADKTEQKLTTGFPMLDIYINEGGPTRGDVFAWTGPVGRGKSILLIHCGRACVEKGLKVLHITLELSEAHTMERYGGAFTGEPIKTFIENRVVVEQKLDKLKNSMNGDLRIFKFPPDEISVDTIYQIIDMLRRTQNWTPDVLVVDYLELLLSRNPYDNRSSEYERQKKVATQLRGVADNANVLVFTAMQTNREALNGSKEGDDPGSGGQGGLIGINKIAESYGKAMALDYIVSINQTIEEKKALPARMRLLILKNRNGPSDKLIGCRINYETMQVRPEEAI